MKLAMNTKHYTFDLKGNVTSVVRECFGALGTQQSRVRTIPDTAARRNSERIITDIPRAF